MNRLWLWVGTRAELVDSVGVLSLENQRLHQENAALKRSLIAQRCRLERTQEQLRECSHRLAEANAFIKVLEPRTA